jgi:O-succinylbenzoate synthase
MSEEQAIEFFRAIDPVDADLQRLHTLGVKDPYDYKVIVPALMLSAAQVIELIRKASAHNLEAIVSSQRGEPVFVVDKPERPVVPAVVPK